jgi:bla regulator protein BlaR1
MTLKATGLMRVRISEIFVFIVLSLSGALVQAQTAIDTVPEWQKAAGGKLSFEVASIKLANLAIATPAPPSNFPLNSTDSLSWPGGASAHGRLVAETSLSAYIQFAYKLLLSPEQKDALVAHVPTWVSTDNYVINAQAGGDPTKEQMRLMMQSLLADRFKLAVHFDRQEASVIALVLDKPGKTGPKLFPHSNGPPCDTLPADVPFICETVSAINRPNNSTLMGSRDMTLAQIAAYFSLLQQYFPHTVVDQTGLSGRFDFTLEWTRESNNLVPPDPQGTTIQEALQDQLGLTLKSTKMLMDTLVIDHVERPSEN